jgi:hypothetical protein
MPNLARIVVIDPRGSQDLLGVGRPDDTKFALPVHWSLSPLSD